MSYYYPAQKIGPYNLWIGSKQDSRNVTAAQRHNIGLVVNCTRDLPFLVPRTTRYRVPVDDTEDEADTMMQHLPRALFLIDQHLRRGDGVLVHCFAGISRSASVVAAYLMYREGVPPAKAMRRIRKVKPETFGPSPNFEKALNKLGVALKKTQ